MSRTRRHGDPTTNAVAAEAGRGLCVLPAEAAPPLHELGVRLLVRPVPPEIMPSWRQTLEKHLAQIRYGRIVLILEDARVVRVEGMEATNFSKTSDAVILDAMEQAVQAQKVTKNA